MQRLIPLCQGYSKPCSCCAERRDAADELYFITFIFQNLLDVAESAVDGGVSESKVYDVLALIEILLYGVCSFPVALCDQLAVPDHRHVYRDQSLVCELWYRCSCDLVCDCVLRHLARNCHNFIFSDKPAGLECHQLGISRAYAYSVCFSSCHCICPFLPVILQLCSLLQVSRKAIQVSPRRKRTHPCRSVLPQQLSAFRCTRLSPF